MVEEKRDPALSVRDYVNSLPFTKRVPIRFREFAYGKKNVYQEMLKSRQEVRQYVFNRGTQIRVPDYNYAKLYDLSNRNWLLRQIFRAIIGEVVNAGWEIKPRFKKKCKKCETEYDSDEQKECDICGGKAFDEPDWKQFVKLRDMIEKPFEDKDFSEFTRSTLWYDLALDDAFWEIVYAYSKSGRRAKGFRVIDATNIFPLMDQHGRLGDKEQSYFCPICYDDGQMQGRDEFQIRQLDFKTGELGAEPTCPTCGGQMVQTAYKQIVGAKIVSRWGADEIIHISSTRVDPEPFGKSKIVPCLKHLYVIGYMDEYNLQSYGHGHLSGFLAFPGLDQTFVEGMQKDIEAQMSTKDKQDVQSGDNIKSLETAIMFIGIEDGKQPISIPLELPMDKMQSLDFYKLYVEKVSGVWGVTPVFTSTSTAGSVESRPQIDVQNRVTKGYISDIEKPFNEQLLAKFGITDYVITSGKIESRDELRDAQIKLTNSQAVSLLRATGFDVTVSEDLSEYTSSTKAKDLLIDPNQSKGGNSRAIEGKAPQNKDGAAGTTMATGTEQGVPIQEPEAKTKDGRGE